MDIIEVEDSANFRHPWEISRARRILSLAGGEEYQGPFADIGSGDLYFAGLLKRAKSGAVTAVDEGYSAFKPDNPYGLPLLTEINGLRPGSIRTAFLLDVLEHVENPELFLRRVSDTVIFGGKLVLTVPAHQFLFSAHDLFLKHKRRYTKAGIKAAAAGSGFEIEESFYFYFSLFIARCFERLLETLGAGSFSKNAVSRWKQPRHSIVTAFAVFLLDADFKSCRFLSKLNISLPGLSLCAILKKTSS